FAEVGDGRSPEPATEELLRSLAALTQSPSTGDAVTQNDHQDDHRSSGLNGLDSFDAGSEDVSEAIETAESPEPSPRSDGVDPDEEDFDALIDAIQGRAEPKVTSARGVAAASSDTRRPADSTVANAIPEAEPLPPPDRRVDERRAPAAEGAGGYSLRVEAARVDDVMNLVGELVLVRNRLLALRTRVRDDDLTRTLSRLNLVTSDLQGSVMRLRMQPLSKAFGRFPRVVRDLARQLGKEVVLEMRGETTELDKGMV